MAGLTAARLKQYKSIVQMRRWISEPPGGNLRRSSNALGALPLLLDILLDEFLRIIPIAGGVRATARVAGGESRRSEHFQSAHDVARPMRGILGPRTPGVTHSDIIYLYKPRPLILIKLS